MKKIAHMEIVAIVADQIGTIDQRYIRILKKHASDPDPGPVQEMFNKKLSHLKKEDGIIDSILSEADITKIPLEHSHDKAPENTILLANEAHQRFRRGDYENAFQFLSWATHFIVDSGTPYHKNSLNSYSQLLNNHHSTRSMSMKIGFILKEMWHMDAGKKRKIQEDSIGIG